MTDTNSAASREREGLAEQLAIEVAGIDSAIKEGCPEINAYARVGKTTVGNIRTIIAALIGGAGAAK